MMMEPALYEVSTAGHAKRKHPLRIGEALSGVLAGTGRVLSRLTCVNLPGSSSDLTETQDYLRKVNGVGADSLFKVALRAIGKEE